MADTGELDAWKRQRPATPTEAIEETEGAWFSVGTHRLRGVAWIAAVVVVCFLAAAAGSHLHPWRSAVASSLLIEGQVAGLNQSGREVWRRGFLPPVRTDWYGVSHPRKDYLWTGDLDGDGRNETLFAAALGDGTQGGLLCLGDDGGERWWYRPQHQPRTGTRVLRNAWIPAGMAVGRRRSGRWGLWVSFVHADSSSAVVVRLSPKGAEEAAYTHSGHLHVLKLWRREAGGADVLLAGGINNRLGLATLVALNPEELSGVSSEDGDPAEQLSGRVSTSEYSRVFFGRTSVSHASGTYNSVRSIEIRGERLAVETDENLRDGGYAVIMYELDGDFRLLDVRVHDTYRAVHSQFMARGLLQNGFTGSETEVLRKSLVVVNRSASEAGSK